VEDLVWPASKVDGKKLNEDVASAKSANSVGDENPSGSDSIALLESMTLWEEVEDSGAAGLEKTLMGCDISGNSGSGLSSGSVDIKDGSNGVGMAVCGLGIGLR
jgi:hypothetical protein